MKPTKEYCCHYYHDGSKWAINIHAYDDEDAKARVAKLGYLVLDGELIATIPAFTGSWLPNLICWARSLFTK